MHIQTVFRTVDQELETSLDFLCKICSFEAQATDKQTLDRMTDFIQSYAVQAGFSVERIPFSNCGDFLCIDLNPGAPKACALLAHMDTVHPAGVFGTPAVQRLDDRIIAPGAIDCKGGIAIALLMMGALKQHGYPNHIRLLLTSDEEISNRLGGAAEQQFFRERVAGFPCAINCETSEKDEVVISRKGILKYRVDIQGISGHSGIHYFECRNPILEAAHKIIALQNESTPGGITYSCNIVEGGVLENIIPETCSFRVDVRVPTHAQMEQAAQTVQRIVQTVFVDGTSATLTPISRRPPMEKTPDTLELFHKMQSICRKYGLGDLTPVESGGGSDSCYTQAAGVPSLCGMGACGEFCHTNREYALTASISLRAKILAAYLLDE